jgi:hypothetical protein
MARQATGDYLADGEAYQECTKMAAPELMEVHPFVSCSHVGEVWKSAPLL